MNHEDELWLWSENLTGHDWDFVNFDKPLSENQEMQIIEELDYGELYWYFTTSDIGELESKMLVIMGRCMTALN